MDFLDEVQTIKLWNCLHLRHQVLNDKNFSPLKQRSQFLKKRSGQEVEI